MNQEPLIADAVSAVVPSRGLEENDRLETLVEQDGVLGGLARERYFLNREHVFYLNGNFNFAAWNFVKFSNAGNGNLEFMRSFMQFQCKNRHASTNSPESA